jgi:hypothetical protein
MPLPASSHDQQVADDRLKSALLSRLILAGFTEDDAQEAANFLAGFLWFLVAVHRLRKE